MTRDFGAEIMEAIEAKDIKRLGALAFELKERAAVAEELERRERERKAMQADRQRVSRAKRHVTSRDVTSQAVTSQAVTNGAGNGLARIEDKEPLKAFKSTTNKKHNTNNGGESHASPFSKADCDALYERWTLRRGGVKYPVFRTALLPLYPASGARYELADLLNAIDAFSEAASAAPPEYGNLWNSAKFVGDVTRWIRLGKLPLVDEWGEPTERGRAAKVPVGT